MYKNIIYIIVWTGLIVYASIIPSNELPKFNVFENFDKVVHFCMYYGQTFLLIPIFSFVKNKYLRYGIVLIISISFGSIMEWMQSLFTTTRSADFNDFIADSLGALIGIISYKLFIEGSKFEKIFFK